MATTFTFTSNTYAGSLLAGYMSKSLLGPKLVENGLITVIDNIKKRKVLLDIDDEIELKTWSPSFAAQTNAVTRGESYLDPVKYEIAKEYTFEELIQSWEADGLKPGSFQDTDGTVDLTQWLVDRMVAKSMIANEKLYLLGKAATSEATFSSAYTGLLPKIRAHANTYKMAASYGQLAITGITKAASGGVVTVASTATLQDGDRVTILGVGGMTEINGKTGTITVLSGTTFNIGIDTSGFTTYTSGGNARFINQSNVIAVLSSIDNRILDKLRQQPDLKLQVPLHVARAYKYAQAAVANGAGSYWVGDKVLDFLGRNLVEMPYWEDNSVLVGRTSNLFLGVDLIGDKSEINVKNMKESNLDEIIRFKMVMKSDVTAKFYDELLYLSPLF